MKFGVCKIGPVKNTKKGGLRRNWERNMYACVYVLHSG